MAEPRVILMWDDNNEIEQLYKIYRSDTSMDTLNMPPPIATLVPNTNEYTDIDVIEGNTYYYIVSAYTPNSEEFSVEVSSVAIYEPMVPGNETLIAGTTSAGYYGTVSNVDFINGTELSSMLSYSEGIERFTNSDWLKFSYEGNVVFVAKQHIRENVTWASPNSLGIVDGTTSITVGSFNYSVSFISDFQWIDLIYNVSNDPSLSDGWDNYTLSELDITGMFTLGSRVGTTAGTVRHIGNTAIDRFDFYGTSGPQRGWRPVLTLIPNN